MALDSFRWKAGGLSLVDQFGSPEARYLKRSFWHLDKIWTKTGKPKDLNVDSLWASDLSVEGLNPMSQFSRATCSKCAVAQANLPSNAFGARLVIRLMWQAPKGKVVK